jgi:sulfur relay (sulfurtransferase) DsrC/TusE family protein
LDDLQVQVIDIQAELDLMGLTYSLDHAVQHHLTRAFYTMWKISPPISQLVKKTTLHVVNKKYRLECYPMKTLNSRKMFDESAVVVSVLEEKRPDNEPHENETLKRETSFKINGGGIGASDLLKEL